MERPKSMAFNGALSEEFAYKKFSGFRSLCITPFSWHTYNNNNNNKYNKLCLFTF